MIESVNVLKLLQMKPYWKRFLPHYFPKVMYLAQLKDTAGGMKSAHIVARNLDVLIGFLSVTTMNVVKY